MDSSDRTSHVSDRAAILFHLGNGRLWPDFQKYLERLVTKTTDLYVNINAMPTRPIDRADKERELKELRERVERVFPQADVMITPEQGQDIGGFFRLIDRYRRRGVRSDRILFLHTKTDPSWRQQLIEPLLDHRVREIFQDPNVGMLGAERYLFQLDHLNTDKILELGRRFGFDFEPYIDVIDWSLRSSVELDIPFFMDYHSEFGKAYQDMNLHEPEERLRDDPNSIWKIYLEPRRDQMVRSRESKLRRERDRVLHPDMILRPRTKTGHFIAGTIFWLRAEILDRFLDETGLDPWAYSLTLVGDPDRNATRSTYIHAWERLFGLMTEAYGYRIVTEQSFKQALPKRSSFHNDQVGKGRLGLLATHLKSGQQGFLYDFIMGLGPSFDRLHLIVSLDHRLDKIGAQTIDRLIQRLDPKLKSRISYELVPNQGHDFWKWLQGLNRFESVLDRYRWVVCFNDSLFVTDLQQVRDYFTRVWDHFDRTEPDIWGLTDSCQPRAHSKGSQYHLQSYYRAMNPTVTRLFHQRLLEGHWDLDRDLRHDLIRSYEIGFCQDLIMAGYRLDAYHRVKELYLAGWIPDPLINLTHSYPELLLDQGFPLIKKKIFWAEIPIPEPFDLAGYLEQNPDLDFKDLESARDHYINHGYWERRHGAVPIPTDFDLAFYRRTYPDVPLGDEKDHYRFYGYREGRHYGPGRDQHYQPIIVITLRSSTWQKVRSRLSSEVRVKLERYAQLH